MEIIIILAVLTALILMIRKVGVSKSNKDTASNLQPLQNTAPNPQLTTNAQPTPTTQNPQPIQSTPTAQNIPQNPQQSIQTMPNMRNIPQNPQPQSNSNTLDTITKAGLIGTAAGLGLIGAGLLLGRNNYYNYYNYYNPYTNPDTSLADHLHDLIWNDGCCKCDNDVIYNTFSSCDDTNFLDDSSCSWNDDSSCNSWDFGYDNNNYNDDSYSWNSWDSGDDSSW